MIAELRKRITYANVTASLALFLALSAGAYAIKFPTGSIKAEQIAKNAVGPSEVRKNAISSTELANTSINFLDLNTRKPGGVGAVPPVCPPGQIPTGFTVVGGKIKFNCRSFGVQPSSFSPGLQPCPPGVTQPNAFCLPMGETASATASAPGIPFCTATSKADEICFNATNALTPGTTVKGVIGFEESDAEKASSYTAYASFPYPTAPGLDSDRVLIDGETPGETCAGSPTVPDAPRGTVCIYLTETDGVEEIHGHVPGEPNASVRGFAMRVITENPDGPLNGVTAEGIWAYTAP